MGVEGSGCRVGRIGVVARWRCVQGGRCVASMAWQTGSTTQKADATSAKLTNEQAENPVRAWGRMHHLTKIHGIHTDNKKATSCETK